MLRWGSGGGSLPARAGGCAHEESSRPRANLSATDAETDRRGGRDRVVGADHHEFEHSGVCPVCVRGPMRAVFRVLGGELCSPPGCAVLCRTSRDLRPRRLSLLPNCRRRLLLRRQRHSCTRHRLCRLRRLPWWLAMHDDLWSGTGSRGEELRSKPQGLRGPVWHGPRCWGGGPDTRRLARPRTLQTFRLRAGSPAPNHLGRE